MAASKRKQIEKDKGMKITKFPQDELQKMTKLAKEKVWYPYAEKLDQKGMKGTEILEEVMKTLAKY